MNKITLVLIVLLMSLVGCSSVVSIDSDIEIVGDINRSVSILEVLDDYQAEEVNYYNEKIYAVSLEKIISSLEPLSNEFDISLISKDGFKVRLDGNTIEDTYLAYSREDKWLYFSEYHPKNSRVKGLQRIIVVRREQDEQNGLNIILEDESSNFSIGQLYEKEHITLSLLDGQTKKTVDNQDYTIDVMKVHQLIPLSKLLNHSPHIILIASALGDYEYLYPEDYYIELSNNNINLFNTKSGDRIQKVVGVIYDPPSISNLDVYDYVKNFLSNEQRAMVIVVDGFSYYQYQDKIYDNEEFFMSSIENVRKSTTVYKPVTNAGLAAIISGVSPKKSGVLNRSFREVNSTTIFEMAEELGKTSIMIQGNTNILNIEVETVLNFDRNNDGYNDDEIYQSALDKIDNYDLLFVHFHNVDDAGHTYGPMADETITRLKVVDTYIEDLVSNWHGKVLIVSDHGMRDFEGRGYHGDFLPQDIYVPFMITEGGIR